MIASNVANSSSAVADIMVGAVGMLRLRCTSLIGRRSECQIRTFKKYPYPVTFENVVFPPNGKMKLPPMPNEPTYNPELGEEAYKTSHRLIEARGPEEIHTRLIHNQFGLAAVTGGFLGPNHLKMLEERVNKNLREKQFAIWRIEEPWLPRTKKSQGARLGGGKGRIKRYVTPVRAGRIILEVGGYIIEPEARSFLCYLADLLPMKAEFVSAEILEKRREEEEYIRRENANRFDWDTVMRYNMQNCSSWLSTYDIYWRGKYK